MILNAANATLTPVQQATLQGGIDTLINTLPIKINLTKADRTAMLNIDNERYPYVKRAIMDHAPVNPALVAGLVGMGSMADATNDIVLYEQLQKIILQLLKVIEIYTDLQQVAGSEAYKWFREFYGAAIKGAENNVPGANSVVDDLKTLFSGQGNFAETPPTA